MKHTRRVDEITAIPTKTIITTMSIILHYNLEKCEHLYRGNCYSATEVSYMTSKINNINSKLQSD